MLGKENNNKIKSYLRSYYGFSVSKALSLFCFSVLFSSLGALAFAVFVNYSFFRTAADISERLHDNFKTINLIFKSNRALSRVNDGELIATSYLNFNLERNIGPRDLNLNNRGALIVVKGQKRKLTENIYELRFLKQ